MSKQARTQFDIDATGGMGKNIGAQPAEDRLEAHDRKQANGDDLQGGQASMDQDLVHHHLEEQWGNQAEYLKHN